MERVDKFGRPIFSDIIWQELLKQGDILRNLGYSESIKKRNLFYRNAGDCVFFADMRGTDVVPIWEDPSPLFYTLFETELPRWKENRLQKNEWNRLIEAGVKPRRSFFEEFEIPENYDVFLNDNYASDKYSEGTLDSWDEDGFCIICNSDFQDNGLYCSFVCRAEAQRRYKDELQKRIAEMIRELPKCELCGQAVRRGDINLYLEDFPTLKEIKAGHEHHISYKDNKTILLCRDCHEKVHHTDAYPHLKPIDKPVPKRKWVRCKLCGGGTYVYDLDAESGVCYNCRNYNPEFSIVTYYPFFPHWLNWPEEGWVSHEDRYFYVKKCEKCGGVTCFDPPRAPNHPPPPRLKIANRGVTCFDPPRVPKEGIFCYKCDKARVMRAL